MQGKIKYLVMFILMCMICICNKNVVQGYTGTGSKSNPYIVTKETEIREILTTKGGTNWKYIAVNNNITIRKSIVIPSGMFRIYAKGAGRTIKRSGDVTDAVNNGETPKFCFLVNGSSNVVFGYKDGSGQILRLGGNKSYFTGKKKSSGFVYVGSKAEVTIDKNTLLTNVRNNKNDEGGTAIFSIGNLIINGEISNCEGSDGGAIGSKGGSVSINSTAYIHDCSSKTEGGGIFAINNCKIEMTGGTVSNCTSQEEGGGVFVAGASQCKLSSGSITKNSAGSSGGGIFSGMGATITVGKTDGTGPVISYNSAGTYGGGIRCNGGSDYRKGGTSYFYGGYISNNIARQNVGGISCGEKGNIYESKIYIKNMHILSNSGKERIGGMRIPKSAAGTSTKEIYMINCAFEKNTTVGDSGGLLAESSVIISNSTFTGNYGKKNGGGIYINGGSLQLNSSYVRSNFSDGKGAGVYVAGAFQIRDSSYVEYNNEVYLTKGTYIDVIGKLSKTSGLVAKINSQVNANGTKLVRVGYNGGTASGELYYSDGKKSQKYDCISMSKTQLLRPSDNVNGYEKYWIIISEKYKIQYHKNTKENVENMPDAQDKYWNENITLSKNKVARNGYELEEKKHWNSKADGSGKVYTPGEVFNENANMTLYGIWKKIAIKEIYINTIDRYYVINQNIVLDKKELLKKVTMDDDLHTGNEYELRVTEIKEVNHSVIAKGTNLITENYMNTNQVKQYILKIEARDEISQVKTSASMYVYVLNKDLSNGQVRFISYEYLNTLDGTSKWNKILKNKLITSLSRKENGVYSINISRENIKQIKKEIKDNDYKMNQELNQNIVGKLEI